MFNTIINILGVVLLSLSNIYVWSILLQKKLNFKNYKIYLSIVLLSLISMLIYNSILKFSLIIILMTILLKFMFNLNIKKGIATSLFVQTINVLSEFLFAIILIFVLRGNFDNTSITGITIFSSITVLCADIFVGMCCIAISKLKFVKKLYKLIINLTDKSKIKYILMALIPIIFIFNSYIQLTYYKISTFYVFLLNNLSIYVVVLIILIVLKKENDYIKIYNKYNTTLNSLKEYEDMLDKYRISNHENKNQLLTIRNMILDKNKKAVKYIDEVIKNKLKDDETIMQDISIIPAGGLRGLVYSKILYMKENNIEYELNISKKLRTMDLINKLDNSDILDICQIIGVYIDNAIQAVTNLNEKYINIEMYLENKNLIFEISNCYEGKIALEKIEQKGYTTKGVGHGYGLSLAKKIINKNKKLENQKRLSNSNFTQVLKINMD